MCLPKLGPGYAVIIQLQPLHIVFSSVTPEGFQKTNIQSVLDNSFGWSDLHHESVMDRDTVVSKARQFVERLTLEDEAVRAGASVHVWLSFGEYVHWSRNGESTRFVFNESVSNELFSRLSELVSASCVPVFVNLCTSSSFFHGSEMHMEQVVGNVLAPGLIKLGVPVTCNPLMWAECSNFIDQSMNVPKSAILFFYGSYHY